MRGRFAVVTNVGAGCDGRCCVRWVSTGRNRGSVRRNRVVLAPRPWRYLGGKCAADNEGKKGRSPGRVRISRKTIARGKPGCPGCTCSPCPCASAHGMPVCSGARDLRAQSAPGFPCALFTRRANEIANLRRNQAVRMRAHVVPQIPLSSRTSERSERDPGPICGRPPWHKRFGGVIGSLASICPAC